MKGFLFIVFVSLFLSSPKLKEVRIDYVKAVNNKEITLQLNENLSGISKADNKILVAYKGAVLTLMAKFAESRNDKKEYFKLGATLLNYAVSEKPNNVEIRCIRLGVQENAPKVVGYRKNKAEDKQFILKHYNAIPSKEVKNVIKNFVLHSKSFSEEEKSLFNKK